MLCVYTQSLILCVILGIYWGTLNTFPSLGLGTYDVIFYVMISLCYDILPPKIQKETLAMSQA